ncbi:hypothetical protein E4634_00020 [Mangrovimicrobium sediminis]|uniref:DUF2490 domain-containing protein n=1 Tax=Mangrovimicrobium sediminis TaxID=2562682 RepID=A0A4Z0M8Y7_9GAMM|nr:hypothetical protein [Haliea sp. SAOS-164]TGD75979.1 hypothetical protein E4634_00020 [Haliea sp. SAOS-164]
MPVRRTLACLTCALTLSPHSQAISPSDFDWNGQLGIASGLVYRGLDLTSGDVTPNVDVAVEHTSGLYLHGWLTYLYLPEYYIDEIDGEDAWQGMIDLGYSWRASHDWTLTLAHNWYRYTEQWLEQSPDYREWNASVDYRDFVTVGYARSDRLWGIDERQDTLTLSARWPFHRRVLGEAAFGWVDQSGTYSDHYSFARLNLGVLWRAWSAQLQYHHSFGMGDTYEHDIAEHVVIAALNWHW